MTPKLLGKATFTLYSRDLYWSIYLREESQTLRWSGYDDKYWWDNVAASDQFIIRKTEKHTYKLDPKSHEVHQIT